MTHASPSLTKNQDRVFKAVSDASEPLTAYAILDKVRRYGLKAPAQIYRALDKLLELGVVHRLETLNAYVACRHSHRHEGAVIFAICNDCGDVREVVEKSIGSQLDRRAAAQDFTVESAIVELRGVCSQCSAKDARAV